MKRLFALILLLPVSAMLHAQITLNQADYAGWTASADTLRSLSAPSTITTLTIGANQNWDLSTRNYLASPFWIARSPGTSPFPGASYKTDFSYNITTGMNLFSSTWDGNNATGIESVGEHLNYQAFWLGPVTLGPNDSLVFPTQDVAYSTSRTVVKFPATYNTFWVNDYNFNTLFTITVAAASWNHAPGIRRSYVIQTDTVKGWGRMRVKTAGGTPSGWMDVLQVKTHYNSIDSFYVNGTAVPDADLANFGLSQGMETDIFTISYYRTGEVTPLLRTDYTDGSYATVQKGMVHTQRLSPDGITEFPDAAEMSVFPNPSRTGELNISLGNASDNYSYSLVSATGQTVAGGVLSLQAGKGRISLGTATVPGVFQLTLYRNGLRSGVKTVVIE